MFFEGSNEVTRFFGLSLVRDFMAATCRHVGAFAAADPQLTQIYTRCVRTCRLIPRALSRSAPLTNAPRHDSVRDALWAWTTAHVAQNAAIPTFILNNVVTVLTLLIKRDFPERWPSAFHDVLAVGGSTTAGLDLAVRILADLEVEVVMFAEGRTKEEIAHNTRIKDVVRRPSPVDDATATTTSGGGASIAQRLVEFLCRSASAVREANADLSERCLRCLADLVGWVDVSLVACEATLTCVYGALRDTDPNLCGAACACLLELVKKGMEPVQKVSGEGRGGSRV